jgi:hypothetical protein
MPIGSKNMATEIARKSIHQRQRRNLTVTADWTVINAIRIQDAIKATHKQLGEIKKKTNQGWNLQITPLFISPVEEP